jgi:phenylalanine-4-hydroxylase
METEYCEVNEAPIENAPVPTYTAEEHGTWEILLQTQEKLLPGRACQEFLEGLEAVKFPKQRIPALRDVSRTIESRTGWRLVRVEGLVHPVAFFDLLSRKIFPSTDFIRKREEVEYTPAPDMFHDLFGHTPLLTNPDFCEFFQSFGQFGVNASKRFPPEHAIHEMLPRLYWFTVEFGLINTTKGIRAYGSGSVSSPKEIEFCVSNACRKHAWNVDTVAARAYDIWKLQEDVFVIDSFAQLGTSFRDWAKRQGIA